MRKMIKIRNIKEEKGASRFGSCAVCAGASSENADGMYKISLEGASIMLCRHHLIQLRDTIVSFCNWNDMIT